ncbi:hypothetical protein DSO57_1038122 [Entomophthora muscae]|uniref:Uncharacterized protein n=1 Tax=Entomophthora muscae TaxID=34485 RepID=A0ACC2TKN4_9FUNG|nr:hypothetical protein DSO57_1038122 [Entomophthora muscae]
MSMFGRIFHIAADAALVSAVLAGIKHSTGLTLDTEQIASLKSEAMLKNILMSENGLSLNLFSSCPALNILLPFCGMECLYVNKHYLRCLSGPWQGNN